MTTPTERLTRMADKIDTRPGYNITIRNDKAAELASDLRAVLAMVPAPVAPTAAIPEPTVGQLWVSPKPKIKPRWITRVIVSGWGGRTIVYDVPNDPGMQCFAGGWRDWARRTGARPTGDRA